LQSPIQWSQILVSEMHSCILSTSASADWQSTPLIWKTIYTSDHHPGMFIPGNDGC
jgi:hypothetical protein